MKALELAASVPWAIREDVLDTILAIAARENDTVEAVAAKLGRPLDNTRTVEVREDGVAVIPVIGPIARRMNLFTEVSGGTSVDVLARDLSAALSNRSVKGILLDVDSPGGEANGIGEMADMIRAASAVKPVVGYASSLAASGGYWLLSACSEVVVAPSAMLGSIGVVMKARNAESGKGWTTIKSGQSPLKQADPSTESGRASIQGIVDDLADVFVASVAANRGTTPEKVLRDFGRGGMLVGKKAVRAGMADRIGSFEETLARLAGGQVPTVAVATPVRAQSKPAAAREGETMGIIEKLFGAQSPRNVAIVSLDDDGELSVASESTPESDRRTSGKFTTPAPIPSRPDPEVSAQIRQQAAERAFSTARMVGPMFADKRVALGMPVAARDVLCRAMATAYMADHGLNVEVEMRDGLPGSFTLADPGARTTMCSAVEDLVALVPRHRLGEELMAAGDLPAGHRVETNGSKSDPYAADEDRIRRSAPANGRKDS